MFSSAKIPTNTSIFVMQFTIIYEQYIYHYMLGTFQCGNSLRKFSTNLQACVVRVVQKTQIFCMNQQQSLSHSFLLQKPPCKFFLLTEHWKCCHWKGRFRPQNRPKYKGNGQYFTPDFVLAITFNPMHIFQFRFHR